MMKKREIGSTGVCVSEISLGCWTLGGENWSPSTGKPIGWKNVNNEEAIEAIQYALAQGVNHFDNADVYGNGRAERLLAQALGRAVNDVVIATKVGHFCGTAVHAYEPMHIRHQCEQSLLNLNRDYIDIYYFHHGDFGENDQWLDGAIEMMSRLKEEGKIRLIGLSAYSTKDFKRLVPNIRPQVLQSWANALDDNFICDGSEVRTLLDDY
ncbi:MAG: aldo/keto reductase, partial [Cytophagales bacterium]|nr:aldo/keto reductase [Cytophagales bacterium]